MRIKFKNTEFMNLITAIGDNVFSTSVEDTISRGKRNRLELHFSSSSSFETLSTIFNNVDEISEITIEDDYGNQFIHYNYLIPEMIALQNIVIDDTTTEARYVLVLFQLNQTDVELRQIHTIYAAQEETQEALASILIDNLNS